MKRDAIPGMVVPIMFKPIMTTADFQTLKGKQKGRLVNNLFNNIIPARLQQRYVDAGWFGIKAGKGFYNYE